MPSDARCGYISATGHLALSDPIPIMALDGGLLRRRKCDQVWLTGARFKHGASGSPRLSRSCRSARRRIPLTGPEFSPRRRINPLAPAAPASKLGFSLGVRPLWRPGPNDRNGSTFVLGNPANRRRLAGLEHWLDCERGEPASAQPGFASFSARGGAWGL